MKKAHTALRKNQKDRAEKLILQVFTSLVRLRNGSKVKAARDMLIIDVLLSEQHKEKDTSPGPLRALLSETRNRSALRASLIVMFLQQYCGINVRFPTKLSSWRYLTMAGSDILFHMGPVPDWCDF